MSKKILTVDDSATVRQMVTVTLKSAGYEVVEAQNGREGLGMLSHSPAMVITDINMPVLDGIGFIRELRTNTSARFTPVVVLTTESEPAKKQAAKAAGATAWIVKPFRPEQLLSVVQKVLG